MPYTIPLACGMFLVVIGLPVGLYGLLARNQRRVIREIRQRAQQRGWTFHRRRWTGNPTSFRIEGQTASSVKWILTTNGSEAGSQGWSVALHQRFPSLAGVTDVAIAPRDSIDARLTVTGPISPNVASKIATMSGTAAGVLKLLREAREVPSCNDAFDKAYRVLMLPGQTSRPPVDSALAASIMDWPTECVAPHSTLFWRDPFAFHAEVRLPGPPNWATIEHLLTLGETLIARIPQNVEHTAPSGIVDRLAAGLMR